MLCYALLTEANEILGDTKKRSDYDRFGVDGSRPAAARYAHEFNPFHMFGDMFEDAFDDVKGGTDVQQSVTITLEEAYTGCKKDVDCSLSQNCINCSGSGVAEWQECPLCHGTCRVERNMGPIRMVSTCTRCRGNGKIGVKHCPVCDGTCKRIPEVETCELSVPAGIASGNVLRIIGKGELSRGQRGDIYCTVSISEHRLFNRDGINLLCEWPITYAQSVLGDEIEIPLLSGELGKLVIPKNVISGCVLRIRGAGMPMLQKSGFGDLLVKLQVVTPNNPSDNYLELVKKLSELDDKEVYEKISEFKSKISLPNNEQ